LSEEFLEEMRERIIKELLDVLILGILDKSASPMSGYDIISLVQKSLAFCSVQVRFMVSFMPWREKD
jgi:hypothetical protein